MARDPEALRRELERRQQTFSGSGPPRRSCSPTRSRPTGRRLLREAGAELAAAAGRRPPGDRDGIASGTLWGSPRRDHRPGRPGGAVVLPRPDSRRRRRARQVVKQRALGNGTIVRKDSLDHRVTVNEWLDSESSKVLRARRWRIRLRGLLRDPLGHGDEEGPRGAAFPLRLECGLSGGRLTRRDCPVLASPDRTRLGQSLGCAVALVPGCPGATRRRRPVALIGANVLRCPVGARPRWSRSGWIKRRRTSGHASEQPETGRQRTGFARFDTPRLPD